RVATHSVRLRSIGDDAWIHTRRGEGSHPQGARLLVDRLLRRPARGPVRTSAGRPDLHHTESGDGGRTLPRPGGRGVFRGRLLAVPALGRGAVLPVLPPRLCGRQAGPSDR